MVAAMKRSLLAVTLWCAASGCITSEDPTTDVETEAITAADFRRLLERDLLAADAQRSRRASRDGFALAVLASTAADATYLAPNQPLLRGKAAIAAFLDADDPTHAHKATFDPRRVTVSADGLIGTTFGWNVITTAAADGTVTTTYGKYATMWRRQAFGWRAVAHVQNPTGFTPSPAPADFPLLDDEAPVIRLADPRVTAAQIADADRAFAAMSVAQGTGPAFPAFADEDAVAVSGPIIYGHDAIAASHAGDPPPSELLVDWAPVDSGASFTGDLGWSIGVASFTDATGVAYSHYLTVWERQPDQAWKWIVDMGNPAPAPAP
jgi:ketosteroid isomerase-like protein